jgi:hypothetical protein
VAPRGIARHSTDLAAAWPVVSSRRGALTLSVRIHTFSPQPIERGGHVSKHRKKESALERKATKHHDFIGEAEPERAEAKLRKHERLERETVRAMAAEFESVAKGNNGAIGPEIPLRIPRSIGEAKRILEEAPDLLEKLRTKAEDRLARLPPPFKRVIELGESAAGLLFAPFRIGWRLTREFLAVPAAMLRVLRQQEA